MDKNNKNLIIRTALGAVAGAAIAALITPKTGEVIKSSSSVIKTKGAALGRGTRDKFSSIKQASTDGLQQSAGILKERAGSIAETVKQKLPSSITYVSGKNKQNETSSEEKNSQSQKQADQNESQNETDHSQAQEQSGNQSEDETGSEKSVKKSGTVVSNNDDTTSADKDNR